jgi:hypothetical protein
MSGIVPTLRPEPSSTQVVVGAPVTGNTWQALAGLGNWLRGKGAMLVPWCDPRVTISAASNQTFRFRVKTRSSAIQRVWIIYVRASSSTLSTLTIKAPGASGTSLTAYAGDGIDARRTPIIYTENLASQSATEQQIDINVAAATGGCIVDAICCYEQDRPVLQSDSTDYGVDLFTCASGQPIYDGANVSVGGVYDALTNSDARRVGIFHWTQGDGASTTTGDLLSIAVPVLVRKLGRSDVTGSVKWSAYAKVTAGTGTITLEHVNDSGTFTDAATVTGTSYAWTSARTVSSFDCDDLTTDDGLPGGWDMLNFERAVVGGTLTVQSISVWQDD